MSERESKRLRKILNKNNKPVPDINWDTHNQSGALKAKLFVVCGFKIYYLYLVMWHVMKVVYIFIIKSAYKNLE